MTETTGKQFGLIVAYVIPGFIGLAGMAPLVPAIARWLQPVSAGDLGVGPPLYAVLAAIAVGNIVSCFRWLTLDQIHAFSGINRPELNDSRLANALGAFDYLVQNHFRYYEFCGNTLVSLLWAYSLNRWMGTLPFFGVATDLLVAIVSITLFAASRDALAKYYNRTGRLIGQAAEKEL